MMNNNINIINNSNNNNSRSTNGSLRESLVAGRNIPMGSQYYRRGHNVTGGGGFSKNNNGTDENLDLFSKNRRGLSVSDESSDGMLWVFFQLCCRKCPRWCFVFLAILWWGAGTRKRIIWSFYWRMRDLEMKNDVTD